MAAEGDATRNLLLKGGTYAVSSGLSQAVMFAAWSVLPWMVPATVLGQLALLSFLTDLVTRFAILGTDGAIVRFYSDEDRRAEVLRAAWMWVAAGACVAGGVIVATQGLVPRLLPGVRQVYGGVYPLVFLTAASSAFAAIVLSHFIGLGRATTYGKVVLVRSIVTAAGFLLAGWLKQGVGGLLAAQMAASLSVAAAFLLTPHPRLTGVRVSRKVLSQMGTYGLPMTGYAAISLLSDYTGRLVLDRTAVLGALGIYQFYFQIAMQANGLWGSLNKAWSPHVFGRLKRDRDGAVREITRMVGVVPAAYATGLALLFALTALGVPQRLLPTAYASQVQLFGLLLLGPLYTSIYTVIYPRFYFNQNTIRVSLVQSALAIITMAATVLLTVQFRSYGAALGWVLGTFLTPIFYLVTAPAIRREMPAVLRVHAVWGVVGAGVWWAVVSLRADLLGAAILLTGALAVAWKRIAPAQPAAA